MKTLLLLLMALVFVETPAASQTTDLDALRALSWRLVAVGDSTGVGYGLIWQHTDRPGDSVWAFTTFEDDTTLLWQAALTDTLTGRRLLYTCPYRSLPCEVLPAELDAATDSLVFKPGFLPALEAYQTTRRFKAFFFK